MPTYENVKYLTLPQQVQKNKSDLLEVKDQIDNVGVGPQGATGPKGETGIQGPTGPGGIDATTLDGTSSTSVVDATLGGYSIDLTSVIPSDGTTKVFIITGYAFGS